MIVVDTSVWVDYLRLGARSPVAREIEALMDDDLVVLVSPVRVELMSSIGKRDVVRLRRVLSALPCWIPSATTWSTMESWADEATAKGHRFGMGDLLVAATAKENGAAVWSLDADFATLARLGFVDLHKPGI